MQYHIACVYNIFYYNNQEVQVLHKYIHMLLL